MARKTVPLVTGTVSGIIGNALVEEDGQITLVNFDESYREMLKDTWLSAFSYYYLRKPQPHVMMLPKTDLPPNDASRSVIDEAADGLIKIGFSRLQAQMIVGNLILNGFVITRARENAEVPPG